ncbi:DEAD/DEAH box helicase [Erysipelothrix sp. HDW6C]|uniref:DEAD/DEAH box helicase n=1 Tax=Erysipelothrix sp. HDW6C TaxID=2714930 RepID=UPI00140C80AB|nr:DEAD/DEAH box helicase [Erysipelothrix sp. HDW6C]QIK69019.1 DEAD/DEAH box helicase [Erysipelothrix sp. HDW6C]
MTFKELDLSPEVVRAITEKGYEAPTDIQQQAVPILLNNHDLLAQSQTGTGKTAAFGLPIVSSLEREDKKITQALILCPTRELCMQVAEELRSFARYKDDLEVVSVYGGAPIDKQIRDIKRGVDIVVATPGRLMDHIRRRTIRLNNCHKVVLDEADEMLNMGFVDDIREIFTHLPEERQMAFFSATMPKEIIKLSDDFLVEPQKIALSRNNLTVSRIEQIYYNVESNNKVNLVIQLLQINETKGTMIFCNTKKMVDELATELNKAGYPALGLHGDMKQEMRTMVMNRFKRGMVKVLIATDVAARGIDVDSMDVVINYDIPQELEYYVHRIGRTGRAGKEGLAITLVTRRQRYAIKQIERLSNSEIKETPLPTKDQLNQVLVNTLARDIRQWSSSEQGKLFSIAYEGLAAEGFTQEEIVTAFINKSIAENNLEAIKGDAPSKRVRNQGEFSKIGLSIGARQGISAAHLVSAIATATGIRGKDIGRIVINDNGSTVEIPRELAKEIMPKIEKTDIKGNNVSVEMLEEISISEPRRRREGGGGHNRGRNDRSRGGDTRSRDSRRRDSGSRQRDDKPRSDRKGSGQRRDRGR